MIISDYIDSNLDLEFIHQMSKKLGLAYVPEKKSEGQVCFINNTEVRNEYKISFSTLDIQNYIYGIFHSSAFLTRQKKIPKIDFSKISYPANSETFWQLVELGGQLRQIHLLKLPKVSEFTTAYPIDGDNTVTRKMTTKSIGWEATNSEKTIGKVWINGKQYFDNVPLIAWKFNIFGYQPAQKWLKDCHGRSLSFEDILHYRKIISALTETHRLMQEIDEVGVE